jgi:hypothetical protein
VLPVVKMLCTGTKISVYQVSMSIYLALLVLYSKTSAQDVIVDDRCRNNRHIMGEWVIDAAKTKSFQCCGWGRNDYQWNTALCGNTSYEENDHTRYYVGSTTGTTQSGASSCDCDAKGGHRSTVGSRDSYVWKPTLCNFKPFDGKHFCELLGKVFRFLKAVFYHKFPLRQIIILLLNNFVFRESNHIDYG